MTRDPNTPHSTSVELAKEPSISQNTNSQNSITLLLKMTTMDLLHKEMKPLLDLVDSTVVLSSQTNPLLMMITPIVFVNPTNSASPSVLHTSPLMMTPVTVTSLPREMRESVDSLVKLKLRPTTLSSTLMTTFMPELTRLEKDLIASSITSTLILLLSLQQTLFLTKSLKPMITYTMSLTSWTQLSN